MVEEFLRTGDVLDRRELITPEIRGAPGYRFGVTCGRPLLYPVPPAALPAPLRRRAEATGSVYTGAMFAFDLEEAPPGHRYAGARFTVELDDDGVIAARVHGDGGQFGLTYEDAFTPLAAETRDAVGGLLRRLGVRTDRPSARTIGTQSRRFGWVYTDQRSAPILPRTYGVHALLESPPSTGSLYGTLAVDVDLTGPARLRASLAERVPFSVEMPSRPGRRAAAVRLCMAADVAGYSRHRNAAAEQLQRDLVSVLAAARRAAGIDEHAVSPQPQGDGQFTVLPVGIDESVVIPRLVQGLADALAVRDHGGSARPLRLRFALHRGLVKEADNGWVGRAAVAVHRLLDAPPLRTALTDHPQADFVLAVPDVLFRDVIAHSEESPAASEFTSMTVDLPAKGFREHAWLYVAESENTA